MLEALAGGGVSPRFRFLERVVWRRGERRGACETLSQAHRCRLECYTANAAWVVGCQTAKSKHRRCMCETAHAIGFDMRYLSSSIPSLLLQRIIYALSLAVAPAFGSPVVPVDAGAPAEASNRRCPRQPQYPSRCPCGAARSLRHAASRRIRLTVPRPASAASFCSSPCAPFATLCFRRQILSCVAAVRSSAIS